MDKLSRWFSKMLEVSMVFFLAVMVVLVFGNVVLRYGFNSGISISEEVSRYLFIWLIFFGAVLGLKEHTHIGVDTLFRRLPDRGKKLCLLASHVLMLYCCGLILVGSWRQTVINLGNQSPVSGISIAWVYGVGIFTGIAMGLILLHGLWCVLSGRVSIEDLSLVAESEDAAAIAAATRGARP
jgi:TRAP-type C4-dicarboxylate transport system permease small subunit